jgi:hypothetical protein
MAASKAGVCWKAWHLQKGHWERMSRQFTSPRSTVSMPATKTTCDGRSASLVEASTVALRQDQLARPSGASRLRLRNDRPLRAASLPQNARRHSRAQIKQIAKSIEAFGFTNPILASDELEILAGHGRTAAALLIGMKLVPIVRLSDLSPPERRPMSWRITSWRLTVAGIGTFWQLSSRD